MTIKQVAAAAGLTHQAIYKRIKAHGYTLDMLKDKATGHLTPDGERILGELFNLDDMQPPLSTEVEKLKTEVAELTTEVEKLRNHVSELEERERILTDERDFLRQTLEREQQLQAMTLKKLPDPPPALPSGDQHGLRRWWNRWRKKSET